MSKVDINCHCGTGHLGENPELRTTNNGKSVTDLSVAMTVGFGERQTTVWTKITVWGKTAEFLCQYATKGSLVAWQNAEYRVDSFVGNDGAKRKTHFFVTSDVNIIKDASGGGEQQDDGTDDQGYEQHEEEQAQGIDSL